jgi:hypothetical protein
VLKILDGNFRHGIANVSSSKRIFSEPGEPEAPDSEFGAIHYKVNLIDPIISSSAETN